MSVIGTRIDPHSRHSYENGVTRPQVCLNATGPALVIPAKAGIQRSGRSGTHGTKTSPPTTTQISYLGVPNCRPMVEGGMRKCSAVEDFARRGACPPQGSGWGVAESAVQIRCTKPQLRLFIPSYENRWHPLDLPVSSFRRRPESRGVAGVARTAPKRLHQPPRRFHTLVCRRQPA